MLLFGHIGIGNALTQPILSLLKPKRSAFFVWSSIGTLLPDFIDKPLFHGAKALMRAGWIESTGLITSSRTLGHTGILLALLFLVGWKRKSTLHFALSLGVASHLLLDNLMDLISEATPSSAWMALVFPFFGVGFAQAPFEDIAGHVRGIWGRTELLYAEILGLALFFKQFRKYRETPPLPK